MLQEEQFPKGRAKEGVSFKSELLFCTYFIVRPSVEVIWEEYELEKQEAGGAA
jgi:hypothetical protein